MKSTHDKDQVSAEMLEYIKDRRSRTTGKVLQADYVMPEGVSPEMSELIMDRNKK